MDGMIEMQEFLGFVYGFHKDILGHNVVLAYEGEVTHQVTKAFTSLTETSLESQMEDPAIQKRVFHVMVESLQNISKHGEMIPGAPAPLNKEGSGIFMLCKTAEGYIVTTGNVISDTNIEAIRTTLDQINALDKEGLKDLYKQRIKEGRLSNKGGAGLGFIDIAKKTGGKLHYRFETVSDGYSLFIFSNQISK